MYGKANRANIDVENTWQMLRYLYDELRTKRFNNFDITCLNNVDELYAAIISRWCESIAREGLYKEYIVIEDEELSSPKGQLNIQASISMNTRSRGTLICSYDELSGDIYINHILKGALLSIVADPNISKEVKLEAQKTLMLYNGVSFTDINNVKWKTVKFNNDTMRYKNIIDIIHNLTFEKKALAAGTLSENDRIYQLFKRQLFKWIKLNYGDEDTVEIFKMPFDPELEPQFELKINKVNKIIVIKTEEKALLISVKLQTKELLDDATLGRRHMEDLVLGLREYAKDNKVKVSGCIVYVNTDKTKINLQPIMMNVVNDYSVGIQVVDIHDRWNYVANKINDCYKIFIERSKSMHGHERKKKESNED